MENLFTINEVKLSYQRKTNMREQPKIACSESVYQLLLKCYDSDTIDYRESFKIILLNQSNGVLGIMNISEGGISETSVDIRLIMQSVLLGNASGVILSHNHPSGATEPSFNDSKITEKIKKACEIMNIRLLDHIIVCSESYYSFADNGQL